MNLLLSPTTGQIAAQVDVILAHDTTAGVIGIRAQAPGSWPEKVRLREREFSLAWCPSPISVREKLLEGGAGEDGSGLVVLTPVDDHHLGADVLARFARGRVFAVDSWDTLRNLFQAKEIDARLARWPWLAETLLEHLPAEGYPPAPGGFLDVESAWAHALRTVIGLSPGHALRPDLPSILRWSLDFENVSRFSALSEHGKSQVTAWLKESMGAAGKLGSQCMQAGFASELAPLAVLCGIVFHEDAERTPALMAAAVRLERYFGEVPVYVGEARHLYQAACRLLDSLDQATTDRVLSAADSLFQSLHLTDFAYLSDDLASAFEARLARLGDAIGAYLDRLDVDAVKAVQTAAIHVGRHRLAERAVLRRTRANMAVRLVRRLEQERQQAQAPASALAPAVSEYASDGAFIDQARLGLLGGDELPGLSQTYARLSARIRDLREVQNARFAESLIQWQTSGCHPIGGVLPVEHILQDAIAPLAKKVPVLLLVVDGLSYPIFLEFVDDLLKNGWSEIREIEQKPLRVGLATVPSITEVSRASLLCGRLCSGQSPQEKAGFSAHPALTAVSRANAKPMVFHKGELADNGGLSNQVRDAVGKSEKRVVAVVYNGVDDHLSGSDQLHHRWGLDDLRLLRPLLYEARLGGRIVVITSDHGHVIDDATVTGVSGSGDRWRSCDQPPGPKEKRVEGSRVINPAKGNSVVVPWSETVRYSQKKNGYHGGISLQEMVVPLCLLTPAAIPDGYQLVGPEFPEWWELPLELSLSTAESLQMMPVLSPRPHKVPRQGGDERQVSMFDEHDALAEPIRMEADWIAPVLASSMFQTQKRLAARAALRDEEIQDLLEALAERGGKMTKSALAQRLRLPLLRVSGFINAARRLLNVDQANVLVLDETEGTVTLNRTLLETQFREATGDASIGPGQGLA